MVFVNVRLKIDPKINIYLSSAKMRNYYYFSINGVERIWCLSNIPFLNIQSLNYKNAVLHA